MKNMELRTKAQLPLRFNEKEFVVLQKKRKRENPTNHQGVANSKKCKVNRKVDTFCWVCHKSGKGKVCSECPRIYHTQCLKGLKPFNEQNICPECQMESVEGQEQVDSCRRLKELLMYAIDKTFSLKNIKDIFFKWPDNDSNPQLCNKVDAEILCEKLKADYYKSPIEFFSDFKWILHNCFVIYGDKSEFTNCANQLVKKLKEELLVLEACSDCYFYQNSKEVDETDFFYKICTKPHDIIFAKVKGFTYWPAKCLKITKNGSAYVAFFGTHEMSCVPGNMWFPLKGKSEKLSAQQLQYSLGITELLGYFENLKSVSSETNKKCETTKCDKEIQASLNLPEQKILPEILSNLSAFNALINELDALPKVNEIDCKPNISDIPCFSVNQSEPIPEPSESTSHLTASEPVSVSMTFSEDSVCFNETEIEELLSLPNPSMGSNKEWKSRKTTEENLSGTLPDSFSGCCSTTQQTPTFNKVPIPCKTVKNAVFNNFSPEVNDRNSFPASVDKNEMFENTKDVEDWDSKNDVNDKTQFISSLEPQLNLFLQENSKKIVDTVIIKLLDTLYQTLPSVICKMKKKPKSDKTLEKNKLLNERGNNKVNDCVSHK